MHGLIRSVYWHIWLQNTRWYAYIKQCGGNKINRKKNMIRASMPIQVIVQVYPLHSNKAALVTGPQYNIPLLTVMDEVDQQIKWYKFSGRYQHLPTWHRDIRCQLIKYTWSVGMSTTIVNCWLPSFTWQYPTYLVIRNTPTTQREIHCCVKLL